jgi:putative membrane protein
MNGEVKPFAGLPLRAGFPHAALLGKVLRAILLAVFFLCVAAWAAIQLGAIPERDAGQLAAAVVLLGVATTVAAAAQRAPLQNVLLAAAVIAFIGGGMQMLGAATGVPFGAITYTDAAGPRLFNLLPWPMPLVWVAVVLNARGVARLILRPWRKTRTYGFRVIGLACLLAALFDLGLEPFASRSNRYWLWETSAHTPVWYGAPWVNFLAWLLTTLLILAFATPALISKKPVRHPPQYHPLIIWLVLNGVFAVAVSAHQLWWAAGLIAAGNLVVAVFALRGARW